MGSGHKETDGFSGTATLGPKGMAPKKNIWLYILYMIFLIC